MDYGADGAIVEKLCNCPLLSISSQDAAEMKQMLKTKRTNINNNLVASVINKEAAAFKVPARPRLPKGKKEWESACGLDMKHWLDALPESLPVSVWRVQTCSLHSFQCLCAERNQRNSTAGGYS
jgi:hypothetical protein